MEDEIINIVPGVNWSHLSDDNYTQELNGSDSSGTESSEFMSNTEVTIHTQDPSGLSEESMESCENSFEELNDAIESSRESYIGESSSEPIFEEDDMELSKLLELEKSIGISAGQQSGENPNAVEKKCATIVDPAQQQPKTDLIVHAIRILRENQIRIRRILKNVSDVDLNLSPSPTFAESGSPGSGEFKKLDGPHECTLCDRKFVHASGLLRHMEKHEMDIITPSNFGLGFTEPDGVWCTVIKCTDCGRIFFDVSSAYDHFLTKQSTSIEEESLEMRPIDPFMQYGLYVDAAMKFVQQEYDQRKSRAVLDEKCGSRILRKAGMSVQTLKAVFQCEFCDFLFTEVSLLLKHSGRHTPVRPFECYACEIYEQSSKEIISHWQAECVFRRELLKKDNVKVLRYLVCNICEKTFLSLEELQHHRFSAYHFFPRMNEQLGVLQIPCDNCENMQFNCVKDMLKHYEDVHFLNQKTDVVQKYEKNRWKRPRAEPEMAELKKPYYLGGRQTQTGQNKLNRNRDLYDCADCNRRFLSRTVYIKHRALHRSERRYECQTCKKRFYRMDALKNHQRIHTDEKPFECPYCTKRFRQRADCEKHVRARHGHLDEDALQLLKVHKRRLEAIETAGGSSAALQDEGTSTEISTAEPPQQENINQDAKKDDMQDEKQKDKKVDLVVDSEGDGGDNLTVEVENDWQDDEQQRKPMYLSLPVLD